MYPVTCHAGTEDRREGVLILNLRATWGFTLGPCRLSPEKGPEGQLGQVQTSKIFIPVGVRAPCLPDCSESLYPLHYPGCQS